MDSQFIAGRRAGGQLVAPVTFGTGAGGEYLNAMPCMVECLDDGAQRGFGTTHDVGAEAEADDGDVIPIVFPYAAE
jgi:hypothetical protein